jgi:hypothetical protein
MTSARVRVRFSTRVKVRDRARVVSSLGLEMRFNLLLGLIEG